MHEVTLASDVGSIFDHVLVDEYQDTNTLQAEILIALKPTGAGMCVVGDDAQSIYSFRVATIENILGFPAQFAPPAHVVTLEENYRSSQPILDAANALIGEAARQYQKRLLSQRSHYTRTVFERAHARSAAGDRRPRRDTASRRGLPCTIDDPLRERTGMGSRYGPARGRRPYVAK